MWSWLKNSHSFYILRKTINSSNIMVEFINRCSRGFVDPKYLLSSYYGFIQTRVSFASVVWKPQYKLKEFKVFKKKFMEFLAFKTNVIIQKSNYEPLRSKFKFYHFRIMLWMYTESSFLFSMHDMRSIPLTRCPCSL